MRAFGEEEAGRMLEETRVACIGPITADTARDYGIRVDAEAAEYTMPGLVQAVVDLFTAEPVEKGHLKNWRFQSNDFVEPGARRTSVAWSVRHIFPRRTLFILCS